MKYGDFLRVQKEYEEQQVIMKYQRTRALTRPKTRKKDVVFIFAIYIVSLALICVSLLLVPIVIIRVAAQVVCSAVFCDGYLRFAGIKIVECYQNYATDETRRRCLCVPSCSEYAIACFKKYELIYALIKIRKRLYNTCKGEDFILDFPYRRGN